MLLRFFIFVVMIRPPPRATLTATLLPSTALFRSIGLRAECPVTQHLAVPEAGVELIGHHTRRQRIGQSPLRTLPIIGEYHRVEARQRGGLRVLVPAAGRDRTAKAVLAQEIGRAHV